MQIRADSTDTSMKKAEWTDLSPFIVSSSFMASFYRVWVSPSVTSSSHKFFFCAHGFKTTVELTVSKLVSLWMSHCSVRMLKHSECCRGSAELGLKSLHFYYDHGLFVFFLTKQSRSNTTHCMPSVHQMLFLFYSSTLLLFWYKWWRLQIDHTMAAFP